MYDVIVVGGGLVGVSTAYALVRGGARVLLVDRADRGRATDAGAGILSPETNARDPSGWFEFAERAVGYYPTLLEDLRSDRAGETGYARCGLLAVAVSEEERPAFERARAHILTRLGARGLPSRDDLREVSPRDARRLFPPLGDVIGAIHFRNAARVDGRLLARAIRSAAERRGLVAVEGSVERVVLAGGRAAGAVLGPDTVSAPRIAITGGAWSAAFGEQLGIRIPVEPQRGQIVHLRVSGAETAGWTIVTGFRDHYIVPWPEGRVAVGATRETGSGFDPRPTAAGFREVLTEALRVAPGLADAQILEIRVGLRPLCADGLPVLGAVPGADGVFLATGHGPTGLQLGPYSGKVVADLMLGRAPEVDLTPFRAARFQGPATARV
jgi:glycine/D-amino acid oxidase-like deaminating enzyme